MAESLTGVDRPRTWRGHDVDVTDVERNLTTLWKQLSTADGEHAPVRTRVFNLIAYTRSHDDARRVLDLLDRVPQRHPSRSIVLVADRRNPQSSVDAELAVQCRRLLNSGQRSCYERAVMTVHGRAAEHLASVCIPLLVPQLATYLWWPGQPLFGHRLFHRMLGLADQLIVDSAQFDEPGDGLSSLASLCAQGSRVNDFHWARLTPFRELIAQFFDGHEFMPYVRAMRSISLEFGSGPSNTGATAGVLLLLGWVASRLGWQPETTLDTRIEHDVSLATLDGNRLIPIDIRLRERGEDAAGRLLLCRIDAQPDGCAPASFEISRTQDTQNMEVRVRVGSEERPARVVPVGLEDDAAILSDELEMTGQNNLYSSVVCLASRMAGREVLAPV